MRQSRPKCSTRDGSLARKACSSSSRRQTAALVVAGDGPLAQTSRRRRGSSRLGELQGLYARAAVVVCPSHREGFSIACARLWPMRGRGRTEVGGLRDLVVDGETGLLVPPRDVSRVARGARTPARRPRAAAKAQHRGPGTDQGSLLVGSLRLGHDSGLRGRSRLEHDRGEDRLLDRGGRVLDARGLPCAAAALARLRTRRVRRDAVEPTVCVIVTRLQRGGGHRAAARDNLLELDYRREARGRRHFDPSTDRTHELVEHRAARAAHRQ